MQTCAIAIALVQSGLYDMFLSPSYQLSSSMSTPFRVSLVAASGVFFAALLAGLLHHDTFNGHTLTPLEELPTAFVLAVIFSALALLGTWLGTRRGNPQRLAYQIGRAHV